MNVDKESCAGCFWMDPCGLPPIQTESNITEEALKIKDSTTFILNHINSYADHFVSYHHYTQHLPHNVTVYLYFILV